jgi:hypothetical protein
MATRNSKSPRGSHQQRGEIRVRGKRIPGLDKELTMVRTGPSRKAEFAIRRPDEADKMIRRVGKALNKPGIRKVAIFQSPVAGKIFAYSVDPFDTTKVVREAADGTKRVGRVVAGKFKLT